MHDNWEVPEVTEDVRITPEGAKGRQVRPDDGESAVVRLTVPVNPKSPVALTVDVAEVPETTVTELGLAIRVKSCTVTLRLTL